jgi:hypothetical protein
MVQFEARLVSGHAFRHAAKRKWSAQALAAVPTGKPQRLKPFRIIVFDGIAEAMP